MTVSLLLEIFQWQSHQFLFYVPDPAIVQQQYFLEEEKDDQVPFPYWTKLWPAAKGLSQFLVEQSHWVRDKNVLELAAGLGLPSLVASRWASAVCCSDYIPEAVEVMQKSIHLNLISNAAARVIDWNQIPPDVSADVLLLSDVNYEPAQFPALLGVLQGFLSQSTTIILATPQRLMAKPFLEQLMSYSHYQTEVLIQEEEPVPVSILVLQSR